MRNNKVFLFIKDQHGSLRGFLNFLCFQLRFYLLFEFRELQKLPKNIKRVVFICTGNICRSPAAEHIFRLHSDIPVTSIGLDTTTGSPIHPKVQKLAPSVCPEIDLKHHQATSISDFMKLDGDLYIVMEPNHVKTLMLKHPDISPQNVVLLGLFSKPQKVYLHDPYSSPEAYVKKNLKDILSATKNLAQQLKCSTAQ